MSLPSSLVSIWLSTKCSNACTSQNPQHQTHTSQTMLDLMEEANLCWGEQILPSENQVMYRERHRYTATPETFCCLIPYQFSCGVKCTSQQQGSAFNAALNLPITQGSYHIWMLVENVGEIDQPQYSELTCQKCFKVILSAPIDPLIQHCSMLTIEEHEHDFLRPQKLGLATSIWQLQSDKHIVSVPVTY